MAKTSLRSLARAGFGLGLGVMAAQIVFLIIGAAFFIPGYLMVARQKKEAQPSDTNRITGLVMMGIGVVIMGGAGLGLFVENLE